MPLFAGLSPVIASPQPASNVQRKETEQPDFSGLYTMSMTPEISLLDFNASSAEPSSISSSQFQAPAKLAWEDVIGKSNIKGPNATSPRGRLGDGYPRSEQVVDPGRSSNSKLQTRGAGTAQGQERGGTTTCAQQHRATSIWSPASGEETSHVLALAILWPGKHYQVA